MQMNLLRRFSYWPPVIRAARALRLRRYLRVLYFHLARPPDGIFQFSFGGLSAQFYVRTPEELRVLESAGGAGGEQRIFERLISVLQEGEVAYDIGANVGLYTVLLAKAVGPGGRVVAFEPASGNCRHLNENLRLNRLMNVYCFQKALGDRSCRGKLYFGDVIGSSSLVPRSEDENSGEDVEILAGDEFVAKANLPLPHLVKIDVEGYEYAVINGLRETLAQRRCRIVCCEVHPKLLPESVKAESVLAALRSSRFYTVDIYPRWDGTFHLVATKTD